MKFKTAVQLEGEVEYEIDEGEKPSFDCPGNVGGVMIDRITMRHCPKDCSSWLLPAFIWKNTTLEKGIIEDIEQKLKDEEEAR